MSRDHSGSRVDIHGGGADLVFPHHECESTQNRAMADGSEVGIWFHSALVDYRGEKMSKSRGNIVLARDLLAKHDGMVVRLATLGHYTPRGGGEWFDHYVEEAAERLERWHRALATSHGPDPRQFEESFYAAIDHNVQLSDAVTVADELATRIAAGGGSDARAPQALREFMTVLGLL